jgi:outer membrane beta-barrel protein
MMSRRLLTLLLGLLFLVPVAAQAQEGLEKEVLEEEYHKNIKVFQLKPILKKRRVQVGGFGALTLNPRMVGNYGAGGAVEYHISEYFSVSGQFTQLWSLPTPFKDEVEDTFGLFPERTEMGYATTLRVGVTPVFGKFGSSFAPYWDLTGYLGGGITRTVLSDFAPTLEFGLGLRFYLTEWMAITGEIVDLMYMEEFQNDSPWLHNWTGRAGLALFIPFSFSYGESQ